MTPEAGGLGPKNNNEQTASESWVLPTNIDLVKQAEKDLDELLKKFDWSDVPCA